VPRGPAPQWRQRKQPVLDDWLIASIQRAGGKPGDGGHYGELHITGIATRPEAGEFVRALHRSGRFLCKYSEYQVGIHAKIRKNGNGWKVIFSAVDKTAAKAYVLEKYGPDRSKWPYDPRRRAS
jgi:hypothetical protein